MVYREAGEQCARCGGRLDEVGEGDARYDLCAGCGAAHVSRPALFAMWREIGPRPASIQPRAATQRPLRCPTCRGSMAERNIAGVPVDECAEHGIWFDPNELSLVLATAALTESEWRRFFKDAVRGLT